MHLQPIYTSTVHLLAWPSACCQMTLSVGPDGCLRRLGPNVLTEPATLRACDMFSKRFLDWKRNLMGAVS